MVSFQATRPGSNPCDSQDRHLQPRKTVCPTHKHNPSPTGCPHPRPSQPPTPTSSVDYPPQRGFLGKVFAEMTRNYKSCLVCHINKPEYHPKLKFHQKLGCPALAKHSYIFRKYITVSATIVNQLNKKLPRTTDQLYPKGLEQDEHQKRQHQEPSQLDGYTTHPYQAQSYLPISQSNPLCHQLLLR